MPGDGGNAEEDVARTVSVPTAIGIGPLVTLTMLGVGVPPSRRSAAALARAAAGVLGGNADDRKTRGRTLALGAFAGVGWAGLRWVNGKLTTAGERLELAHARARRRRPR